MKKVELTFDIKLRRFFFCTKDIVSNFMTSRKLSLFCFSAAIVKEKSKGAIDEHRPSPPFPRFD